jgi:quinolinate synthase
VAECAHARELIRKSLIGETSLLTPTLRSFSEPLANSSRSWAHCPWMAMNELEQLRSSFERGSNEVLVDPEFGRRAMVPFERMLAFKRP